MSSKKPTQSNDKAKIALPSRGTAAGNFDTLAQQQPHLATIIQRAKLDPGALTPNEVLQLQNTIGNQALGQILAQTSTHQPIQKKENRTGLPNNLKTGIENLSGTSLDDVRVHYNSPKPKQLQALAYTQGTDIHVSPGQERHLPHESWHAVQQKQKRVQPTTQVEGIDINDDLGLEQEADVMGARALQRQHTGQETEYDIRQTRQGNTLQGMTSEKGKAGQILSLQNQAQEVRTLINTVSTTPQPKQTEPIQMVGEPISNNAKYMVVGAISYLNGNGSLQQLVDTFNTVAIAGETNQALIMLHNMIGQNHHRRDEKSKAVVLSIAQSLYQEIQAWDATLNTLLGANNDPAGIRLQLMAAAGNQPVLQGAVNIINAVAAVPLADRVGLLNEVGNNAVVLANLLTVATNATGAGTPAVRLRRVLDANPATPRNVAALTPFLNAQTQIDDKILRGRITGGALGANQVPTGAHRDLIGGHSQQIVADPATFAVENVVNNPNLTDYVTFRKLVRGDAPGFAADVNNGVPGNIVTQLHQDAQAGVAVVNAPPAFPPAFIANAPPAIVLQRQNAQAAATMAGQNAAIQLAAHQAAAIAAAGLVGPNDATTLRPFINAVTDMHASANAVLTAAQAAAANTQNPTVVNPAIAQLAIHINNFRQTGPVLSAAKNSTLAPAGMSEDAILQAGDQTAAVPATLIRDRPNNNNPPNGTQIETKHQLIINNVVWIAIKENVTFNRPPPPAAPVLTNGQLSSSYPTNMNVIPPDPVHPAQDAEGFSTIP